MLEETAGMLIHDRIRVNAFDYRCRSKNGLPQKAWSLGRRYGVTLTSSASTLPTEVEGGRVSQFRDKVAYLRDANRRKDEIIMQQAMTHAATHSLGATGADRRF